MSVRLVAADVLFTGDSAPILDGAVVLDEDGVILDLGARADVLARSLGAKVESWRGALLPGLVNAHTHLELSGMRGKVSGGAGFVPWVERMLDERSLAHPDDDLESIQKGVDELDSSGVVAVGEVTNSLAAVRTLARKGMAGIVFHEVFGLEREPAMARVAHLASILNQTATQWPARDLKYAPAAHTLYTTHPDAVRQLLSLARARHVISSLHLAEHPAERAFLTSRTGPFADFAKRRGFAIDDFPVTPGGPIARARELGALAPDVLLVHLTDAKPEELEEVAKAGAPVVLCPRSNLFIEVKLPPLPEMLKAGITPALGTDSLASNLSLDILAEARALSDRFPSVPTDKLVEMATWAGAKALGLTELGRIEKGKAPGVLLVEGELGTKTPARWVVEQPVQRRRWIARRTPLR